MLVDSHTHSRYSFDGQASVFAMCRAAIANGVDAFTVTDHYDIDGVIDGFYPDLDVDAVAREIEAAQNEFAGRVQIFRGVELGQPALRPVETAAFLSRYSFDFVIASCHNLAGVPDFSFLDYTDMPDSLIADLYHRMLRELSRHAAVPGIHTVAHLTYPLRYIAKCGRTLDLAPFTEDFCRLFAVMRDHGVALELNTRGFSAPCRFAGSPAAEIEKHIFRLWKSCGGENVSCGSDAHDPARIGDAVRDGYTLLRDIGFRYVLFPSVHGLTHISL